MVRYPRLCGDSQAPVAIAIPLALTTVMLKTDNSLTDKGLNMSYSVSPCGGVVEGPEAIIASPNFPRNYPDNTRCSWLLKFAKGSQIELTYLIIIVWSSLYNISDKSKFICIGKCL